MYKKVSTNLNFVEREKKLKNFGKKTKFLKKA